MAIVQLLRICTPSGIVIDVRVEAVGPQDDDVRSYPVECRTIPSRNFAQVVQAELEARGMVIDSPSFDLAALAIDHIIVDTTGQPLDSRTRYCRCTLDLVVSLPEVPTTYCFDCGQMVSVADTWTKKSDPNYALCEGCFRQAATAGRAKEGI